MEDKEIKVHTDKRGKDHIQTIQKKNMDLFILTGIATQEKEIL